MTRQKNSYSLPGKRLGCPTGSPQSEILTLLQKLIQVSVVHEAMNMADLPEFDVAIQRLCQEAPKVAQIIASSIQKNMASSAPNDQLITGGGVHCAQKRSLESALSDRSSKVTKTSDGHRAKQSNGRQRSHSVTMSSPRVVTQAEKDVTPPQIEESAHESFHSTDESPVTDTAPLMDLIVHAVRSIHEFERYSDVIPGRIHSKILRTLQSSQQEAAENLTSGQWTDGAMWVQVLQMGSAANNKVTILNMLEYMGAWEWYDDQVKLAQRTVRTKKHKLVDRRGAAIHVLNSMQGLQVNDEWQGRWIAGIGRLVVHEGESGQVQSSDMSIAERDQKLQRKRVSIQLSRGQKLSTKLVKELGLGILFSPKIWDYTKKGDNELDLLIQNIRTDPQRMKLLQILSPQLEQLVNGGSTDIQAFYNALRKEGLVSEEGIQDLRKVFALEGDTLSPDALDAALDRLIQQVSAKVFHQQTFDDSDTISINGSVELSCDIFQQLRPGRWFDSWMILAGMHISDKPFFVRYGESVPLDEIGRNNRVRPIKWPLAGWARKIAQFRREARETLGDTVRLVYFCPINHRNEHFTLLEINDQEQMIRHYDSMADPGTINGTMKTRIGILAKEEFKDLGYGYSEAPTPQQSDGWSCGVRVVWNFRRLSNSMPIGSWDTMLNPGRMKMEIVEGLMTCVEAQGVRKYR